MIEPQARIARAGYDDVFWLRPENVPEVFTEKRLELLAFLGDEGDAVDSMRDVARTLDRHVSVVKADLDVLAQHGIVEYETDGRRKVPVLAHSHVFVQPLLIGGEVQREGRERIDAPE